MATTKKSRPKIPDDVALHLWNSAAWRCQRLGCNQVLWRDKLTLGSGKFGEMAHIIAASSDGPRGNEYSEEYAKEFDNLLLLCPSCHKHIDDNPAEYLPDCLRQWKRESEERIEFLLELQNTGKRKVIIFRGPISNEPPPSISRKATTDALLGNQNYPSSNYPGEIDLQNFKSPDGWDWISAWNHISYKMATLLKDVNCDETLRDGMAIFPIWPIPLLVKLGSELPRTIPFEVYQLSRISKKWTTGQGFTPEEPLSCIELRGGEDREVVVLVSISGKLDLSSLPENINPQWKVYEIELPGWVPGRDYDQSVVDDFARIWQRLQRTIVANDPYATAHLFAAVPAMLAVYMGHYHLPNVNPKLNIYELNKDTGKFFHALTIN